MEIFCLFDSKLKLLKSKFETFFDEASVRNEAEQLAADKMKLWAEANDDLVMMGQGIDGWGIMIEKGTKEAEIVKSAKSEDNFEEKSKNPK